VLLLDAGNSRCKWARIENGVWAQQGVAENAQWLTLQQSFALLPAPTRIIVSNVGGEAMAQKISSLCSIWPVAVEFVRAQNAQCGVRNSYGEPARLGSDRWVALIAAWQKYKRACLLVNCGTATTIDTLSNTGEFVGGLILPGVSLMQQSLVNNTAQLTGDAGAVQDYPRNTADAMATGVIRATVGAIQYQYALLNAAGANDSVKCVLSGGAAGKIEMYLGMDVERIDNLVLEGLKIIGETSAC
jgi:type III pantothenate kinase